MDITVTYIDQDQLLHAVTVKGVADVDAGKAEAATHLGVICEAEGWNIADFRMHSVDVHKDPQYIEYLNSGLLNDPRD